VRKLALLAVALLVVPAASASPSAERPVALVAAETANEVLAVSLGPHGGRIVRRIHVVDPLMIAAPLHGPAVVVSPKGTVTLLAPRSLRPIKVFHVFRSPKVAAIAPGGLLAYVTDERTGDLSVIDLAHRRIVGRVFVGALAHHLGISHDGSRIWVALGESASTVVRLDASNPRKPRVIGRLRPRFGAHDVAFAPDGRTVLVTSPGSTVAAYSFGGRLLWYAGAGRGPGHVAFSGGSALVSSGYGSSLDALAWRSPSRAPRVAAAPYGSFNLATYGGIVVTTSLFTGQVSEFRVSDLHRLWTAKVAPAARYVAISLWPR
jgi:DNA-binding beta-propeller fold protein YncE